MSSDHAAAVDGVGEGAAVQAEHDERDELDEPEHPDERRTSPVSSFTWNGSAT